MLRHIDEPATADRIQSALEKVYAAGNSLTRDVGGTAGTTDFKEAILAAL